MTDRLPFAASRSLGTELREIRVQAGLTAVRLAAETGLNPVRLSRLENDRALPREDEILSMRSALKDHRSAIVRLDRIRLLLFGKRDATKIHDPMPDLVDRQEDFAVLAEATMHNRVCGSMVVPGLLQTASYILGMTNHHLQARRMSDEERSAFVIARVRRQKVLHKADRRNEFLLFESCLDFPPVDAGTMAAQCHHLLQMADLPTVDISIVRRHTMIPQSPMTDWEIHDGKVVTFDTAFGYVNIGEPVAVADYMAMFDLLQGVAVHGKDATSVIHETMLHYSRSAQQETTRAHQTAASGAR